MSNSISPVDKFKINCRFSLENLVIPEIKKLVTKGTLSALIFNDVTYNEALKLLDNEDPKSMIEKFVEHKHQWIRMLPFNFVGEESNKNMIWIKNNASMLINGISDELRNTITEVLSGLTIGTDISLRFIKNLIELGKSLISIVLSYIKSEWTMIYETDDMLATIANTKDKKYKCSIYRHPKENILVDVGYWRSALES